MTRIDVHLDEAADGPVLAGVATVRRTRGVEATEFSYADSFLAGPAWPISPDLPIHRARAVLEGLPGALDDSAPDAWGRNLITRRLAARARDAGHVAPTPTEVDFLLGVSDATRQGALRFQAGGSPFLAEVGDVPHLIDLEVLLDAADRIGQDDVGDAAEDAVTALLDAGSGSLGGARPKASVRDAGHLFVAKFPHRSDRWEVIRWEAVALDLAEACGLQTPTRQLVEVGDAPVLLLGRFDRDGEVRIPYLSARSLIGAPDGTASDYLEVAERIADHGSAVDDDLVELWRRIAFSVTINNTDDHLRNHGFLHTSGGWTLSPVFDVNPERSHDAARTTALAGATRAVECQAALMATAASFGLERWQAGQLWDEVVEATATWRSVAAGYGIVGSEIEAFAPALDRWRTRR